MRLIGLMIAGLIAGATIPAAAAQEIQGQLAITRTLTKQRVVLPAYTVRGVSPHKHDTPASPINEWQRVVVYLESDKAASARKVNATLNQTGQKFEPEMLVVPVGSTVSFPNSDPIFHNVFSLSRARTFNLGRFPRGESRAVRFEKSGIVKVFCDIHSHMTATVLVFNHPWFAVPDADGRFELPAVPPGDREITAWHERLGDTTARVRVEAGRITTADFTLPVPAQ